MWPFTILGFTNDAVYAYLPGAIRLCESTHPTKAITSTNKRLKKEHGCDTWLQ
jgi:hypothetical protein